MAYILDRKFEIISFILGVLLCSIVAIGINRAMEREIGIYAFTTIEGFNVTWDAQRKRFMKLHLTLGNDTILTVNRYQVKELRITISPPNPSSLPVIYPLHPGKI